MATKRTWISGSFAIAALVALLCTSGAPAQERQLASATPSLPALAKPDATTLLAAARTALESGDWDRAENLAVQAERIPRGLLAIIKSRWTDTPAKVRRDVQTARIRAAEALIQKTQEQDAKGPEEPPKITQKNPAWKADEQEKLPAFRPSDMAEPNETKGQQPTKIDAPVAVLKNQAPTLAAVQNKFLGMAEPVGGTFTRQPPSSAGEAKRASPKSDSGRDGPSRFTGKRVSSGESALALLKESGEAFSAGDFEGARRYALQAKKLRPSTWDEDNIVNLLTYLRRQAPNKDSAGSSTSAPLPSQAAAPVAPTPTPALSFTEADVTGTSVVAGKANDEECEPVPQWERKSVPVLSSGWCVLIGMAIGAALILLFRHALAGQPKAVAHSQAAPLKG